MVLSHFNIYHEKFECRMNIGIKHENNAESTKKHDHLYPQSFKRDACYIGPSPRAVNRRKKEH